MNKAYLTILLVLCISLSGCDALDALGCPNVSATLKAKDDGKAGTGGGTTFIKVNPDTVKVWGKCSFVLNNPGKHLIHTTSATSWLHRPVKTNGNITMGPAAGKKNEVFKYKIVVDKIGEIDPRARVTR